jgi:hypothetical protein
MVRVRRGGKGLEREGEDGEGEERERAGDKKGGGVRQG